ncbi:MAG: DUF4956 domain-containing protein [Gemmatimonadetes bacterium]|nr:DUF4956 domain-containing protein [Gemmatimonadota bacterium]
MSSDTSSGSEGGRRTGGDGRPLLTIALLYALLFVAGVVLWELSPVVRAAFTMDRLRGIGDDLGGALGPEGGVVGFGTSFGVTGDMAVAAVSMLGALAVMIPVALSYLLIKRRVGYDQSVVHTLLILPVAVTGIVIVVQNSLALAFSLAGIVAAVRFRTTLDDTKDAVYVFLAIGVGLASGVQALSIAAVLSAVFAGVDLTLWKMGFGNIYLDQKGRNAPLGLGDVLAGPGSAGSAVSFGDKRLLEAMTPHEVQEVAHRVARMEGYLRAAGDDKKERKAYSVLLVHTPRPAEAQPAVEAVLEGLAVRWSLAEIVPSADGGSVLEYLVRPREDVSAGALIESVRGAAGDYVRAAELRSLKTLAKSL